MAKFIIDRNKNGTFEYKFVENEGEVLLSSQGYGSKQGCKIGIGSVQLNAGSEEQYDRKKGKNGKVHFTLLSHNGRSIGESEKFVTAAKMEKAITLVKKKAKAAKIEDITRRKRK